MDCPYCGANNRDKAKFCRSCARRIDGQETNTATADPDGPDGLDMQESPIEQAPIARSRKIPKVPIIAGVLLALVIGGWVVMKPRDGGETPPSLDLTQAGPSPAPAASPAPQANEPAVNVTAAPPALDSPAPGSTGSAPPPALDAKVSEAAGVAVPPALETQAAGAGSSAPSSTGSPPPALETASPPTVGSAPPALEAQATGKKGAPSSQKSAVATAKVLEAKTSEPKVSKPKAPEGKTSKSKSSKEADVSKQTAPSTTVKKEAVTQTAVAQSNVQPRERVEAPAQKTQPTRKKQEVEPAAPPTLALKQTPVLSSLPRALAPRAPARPAIVEEMEACATKSFFARAACENEVRARHCPGRWGTIPECPNQSEAREIR